MTGPAGTVAPGRGVVITGAGGGIGRSIVTALLGDGHRVLAVDRSESGLTALRTTAATMGAAARLEVTVLDLAAPTAAARVVRAADTQIGDVDVLINNAGIILTPSANSSRRPTPFWETTDDQWNLSIAVHASTPMALARALAPRMIERGWGRVVNVTTSLGSMIRGGSPTYGPSKAALEAFTAVMAKDLAGTGVTANVLVPGGITNTGMIPATSPYARDEMLQPDVMVAPLRWLLSPAGDEVTDSRVVAALWDASAPPAEAGRAATAPAGWPQLGGMPIAPGRSTP